MTTRSPGPPACSMVVLLVALAAPCARAQVNVEKLRSIDVDGFTMTLNASFSLHAGNTQSIDFGGGLRLDYRHGKHFAFVIGNAQYGELSQKKYRERIFGHVRYNYDLTPWLVTEMFVQGEHDSITLLQARLLTGGGLRVRYFGEDNKPVGLFQGTALMYEQEDLDATKVKAHPAAVRVARWSNYLNVRLVLTESTYLINTTYVQPRVDAFGDLRILDELTLATALTKHLTFTTAFNLRHDSRPPGDVKKTDLALRNGLTVSF